MASDKVVQEILKPIIDAKQDWDDFENDKLDYLDSSTSWKAIKKALEVAEKAGMIK